jgi:hypothetical protein
LSKVFEKMAEAILDDQEEDYNQDEAFEPEDKNIETGNNSGAEDEEEVEDLEEEENEDGNQEFEEEAVEDAPENENEEKEGEGGEEDIEDNEVADQAVTVLVRIRPLLPDEEYNSEGEKTSVAVTLPHAQDRNKIRVIAKEGTQFESILECGYDRVLDMNTTQVEVFETTAIKPAVIGVAHGISACIFA